jgi:hypothetical protein
MITNYGCVQASGQRLPDDLVQGVVQVGSLDQLLKFGAVDS